MGLLRSLRNRRLAAKAEIKAAKARAAKEVKAEAKLRNRREKLLAKQEKNLLKAEHKGLRNKRKHEHKMAKNQLARARAGRVNKDRVKRWIGAARVATPVLIPVAYRLVTAGKEKISEARAHKYGVSSAQLAEFSGHGAPLKARITGIRNTLESSNSIASGFARDVNDRLDELVTSIDNAEFMAPEQRRRAHNSISRDLDQITGQIHDRLKA